MTPDAKAEVPTLRNAIPAAKLEADRISYEVNGQKLLQDISLSFSPGIVHGILGPNGSGKSTLLKTLAGIWKPTQGRVLWEGQDLLKKPRAQISCSITFVPQNPPIAFDFTVEEIVSMGRYPNYYRSRARGKQQELVDWALHIVDAWHLRHNPISRLSTGERQRVYIARALVTEAPILLLDEPTSNLDIAHQLAIWQFLKSFAERGKVVVVALHDLQAAERFCEQLVILKSGCCVAQGTNRDVMNSQLLSEVFEVRKASNQHWVLSSTA